VKFRGAAAALLCAAGVLAAAGCGSEGHVEEASSGNGQQLFREHCGQCHTLADAGTQGRIGPNLDEAFAHVRSDDPEQGFEESTLRDVVRGQIAYPVEETPTGAPGMPANIVTGEDADAVATYVASVAGLPVQGGGGAGGGGGEIMATEGREIFGEAGCGSCHVLEAGGGSGTIGPSLDESKPPKSLVVDRVTNGKGAMPAFGDRLSRKQIDAVADFVAQNAGG
jgi:cbb3-type cytochrome c oxidase subunit III